MSNAVNKDRLGVWSAVLLTFSITFAIQVQAATYYVDAVKGLDSNPGVNPAQPWKTLEKVNSTTFAPGDHILFSAGCRWNGRLNPKGSGAAGNPIVIDRYGDGALPVIDGSGAIGGGVVYLYNQQYWEITNLEITNDAPTGADRRGVMVGAGNFGIIHHIHLKNLYIHHIKGIIGQSMQAKDTGAIGIFIEADYVKDTRFDDILIEGCRIQTIDNTGIFTRSWPGGSNTPGESNWNRRRITNLRIRHNRINDIAKNAMIIRLADGGVVEHNVCWDTAYRAGTGNTIFSRSSRGTVFQYNEGYLNRSRDYDGCLYDADLESPGCIFQYSYSHDNSHGLFWMCTKPQDANIIVRYNISQNDKGNIFCINYANTSCYIYNNVVFVPPHLSPRIIDERRDADKTYYFYNNIIYNLSPTASYNWRNAKRTFANNVFYGFHPDSEPDDPTKITDDPRFIDPGSGGLGIDTLDGYKVQSDSPCIDSGRTIPQSDGLDYWGNPVPHLGSATDRGAHEYPGPKTAPLAQQASNPTPANRAIQVGLDITLNWTAGAGATSHSVYFGTNPRPGVREFQASQTQAHFDPGLLKPLTTYYWRIDENNVDGTAIGKLWSFTTEPIGYPIENITVTASSTHNADMGPENTINGSGLDDNDLHSIKPTDMWFSSSEPLAGVWIEYEFDKVYKLHEMWVWNSNEALEGVMGFGFKNVSIEYSVNGSDYTTLGTTHEFARAPGAAGYAHNTTVDFSGVAAKYVRLTANSNWGILPQYGLSEVRFLYIPVWAREPSPDSGATDVAVDVVLSFRGGREAAQHDVYISSDEQAVIDRTAPVATVAEARHGPLSLDFGTSYYWKVNEVNMAETPTTWQGDVWSFTTYAIENVEDFETGDFGKFPWEYYGDETWAVTSRQKHSGAYSAQAGSIDHDQNTTLRVTFDCVSGNITFYRKVSSELGCDLLKFYIDGVEKDKWSGEEDWTQVSFGVTTGTRTFKWTYSKDDSESEGSDTAWIDDVVFPVN